MDIKCGVDKAPIMAHLRRPRSRDPESWEGIMIIKKLVLIAAAALLTATPALAADDTLTIGFTVSRTGKLNNDSTAQMRGFELWRDEINDQGGIKAGGKQYKVNF